MRRADSSPDPEDSERTWELMNAHPRRAAASLTRHDIPETPGVYAWYRDGSPIYAGRAVGASGLRGRVWMNHLGTGVDLSRSSFRRNVCEHLGLAPTSVTKRRPPTLTMATVALVNDWIRACEVAWVECDSIATAKNLERRLLDSWMPPLSRR